MQYDTMDRCFIVTKSDRKGNIVNEKVEPRLVKQYEKNADGEVERNGAIYYNLETGESYKTVNRGRWFNQELFLFLVFKQKRQ